MEIENDESLYLYETKFLWFMALFLSDMKRLSKFLCLCVVLLH